MLGNFNLNSTQPALPGQIANMEPHDAISAICSGATAQVDSIDFSGGVANSNLYTLEVTQNGITESVSYTSDGTATAAEVAAGLVAAAIADAGFNGIVLAADSGGGVMTLTSQVPGVAFSTAMSGANADDGVITTSTANAARTNIYPGRAVVRGSTDGTCNVPSNANATAKVMTALIAGTAADESFTLTIQGDFDQDGVMDAPISITFLEPGGGASVPADVATGLAADLNAELDARYGAGLSVALTVNTATITATAELAGVDFFLTGAVSGNDGSASANSITIATTTANVPLRPLGVSCDARNHEQDSSGNPYYPGGQPVDICRRGVIAVELDAGVTPSIGDPVLYRATAGSGEALGTFRGSIDSTDCRLFPRAQWHEGAAYTVRGKRVGLIRLRD